MSAVLDAVVGVQTPRVCCFPPYASSAGAEAVALSELAGLTLDPWQSLVLEHSLGERGGDHKWAAFEVALIVARQNGKGGVLEARELAGLFLLGEQLILHSAHELKTAMEAFRRVLSLVQNTPELDAQVKRVTRAHGEEGIELKTGQRLRFVARSTGSGRGFSGDCVILDEAYNLDGRAMSALLPTLSARPNPQLWYASSAPMDDSEQLHAVRKRGTAGSSPSLAYFEWSAPEDCDPTDRAAWAQANPALGIRITTEFVEREQQAMGAAEFARERLGIPNEQGAASVIDMAAWAALADPESKPRDPVAFAVDVSPDHSRASISVAGMRPDGLWHVELVPWRHRDLGRAPDGTGWVVPRLMELVEGQNPCAMVVDPGSGAGSLLPAMKAAGFEPLLATSRDVGQACGAFYDAVVAGDVRHLGQLEMTGALARAKKRTLGDAWAWNRRDVTADITPLVSATLALWGLTVRLSELRDPTENVW